MDDITLRRFHDGDHDAMSVVYHRFVGPVTTVARSFLWSEDLVADAVQQTFVKVWRARDGYDPARPMAPWIYSIARRTAIDLVRREKRRTGEELSDGELGVDSVQFEDVWETFEVRAALDELPAEEREVLRLHHLEGRTHSQIAELLDVPIGTVKSRSHRAHGRLSEMLGHLVGEPDGASDRMEERR